MCAVTAYRHISFFHLKCLHGFESHETAERQRSHGLFKTLRNNRY